MILFLLGFLTGLVLIGVLYFKVTQKRIKDFDEKIKNLNTRLDTLGAEVEIAKRFSPSIETSPPLSKPNSTYHPRFGRVEFEKEIPVKKEENK